MEKISVADARKAEAVGKRVRLLGWVRTRRDSKGGFSFILNITSIGAPVKSPPPEEKPVVEDSSPKPEAPIEAAMPLTSVPEAGTAGAPDQVNSPAASGCDGEVSANADTRPRAISSSCDCILVVTLSRNCSMPARLPEALVPEASTLSGTLSM